MSSPRVVRTGITRTVILVARWAIKVPTGRGIGVEHATMRGRLAGIAHGLLANQSERIWCRDEQLRGKVAPVVGSCLWGFVQVYPRCEPLPDEVLLPSLPAFVGDVKPDNYGMWRGRVVRVDYAVI